MNSFLKKLKNIQNRVNKTLLKQFKKTKNDQNKILNAMKYSILFNGKKIRPFLVYSIGKMLNIPMEKLDIPAAAIECIHAYSLIHDDLPSMDNDVYRRGKPTCHIYFGEANAILAGNALQAFAFNILSQSNIKNISEKKKLAIINELSTASGVNGICYGQYLDLKLKKNISIKKLKNIYHNKTGILIRSAVRISAYSSEIKEQKLLSLLDKYGITFGLIFQICDDVFDIINDHYLFKKKKITYPSLVGLKETRKEIKKLHNKILKIFFILKKKYNFNIKNLEQLTNFIIKKNKININF